MKDNTNLVIDGDRAFPAPGILNELLIVRVLRVELNILVALPVGCLT